MMSDIQAVIFDLDGTLIDSMWIWKEVDEVFLEKRGIQLPDDLQADIEGMSFTETAQYFKQRFDLTESIDEIKGEWEAMTEHYYKDVVELKAGVVEFLEILRNHNIKIGIATSNIRERTLDILDKYGLKSYFDSIKTSCEVGKGKPHPDVFLAVAKDLDVDPKACLVFEDTFAGILGAKRAGMKVYAIADAYSLEYKQKICELADDYLVDFKGIA